MPLYVGLDVSKATTSICVLGKKGDLIAETTVPIEPDAIIAFLQAKKGRFKRIGVESMGLASWVYEALARAGLPIICIEARHAHGILKEARLNKTDRNDARGIAEIMRAGIYKVVHVKTLKSQQAKMLLTSRKLLGAKARDIENLIRGALLQFGKKIAPGARASFERRARDLTNADEFLRSVIDPLLIARAALVAQVKLLEKRIVGMATDDPICARLMAVPGVGPRAALEYRAAIDVPERFARSRDVGVHLGLTPKSHQSGPVAWRGRISKCGDCGARAALFLAARSLVFTAKKPTPLREWAKDVASRRGVGRALVALARRLAVMLHQVWLMEINPREPAPAA